ncbi:hypothetical protein QR680_016922 [Steinernema hermaphroditum]|uniref:DRBM domain-containing protein n=1 Tax=Steinernema hermaphroditum TaxID=289476 RepID=A0AA39HCQ8_9BILA|nr:hypothetical protein QR680_016922 [Steinernema hermaphroditum]
MDSGSAGNPPPTPPEEPPSTSPLARSSAAAHPEPWCGKHINDAEPVVKNVYNYAQRLSVQTDKTPMCRIAELSRYNKLRHEYVLLDESGPAHKKRFTVNLVLQAGEAYEGSGASIKKAQQAAAEVALQHTKFPLPPERPKRAKKDSSNPVQLLVSVAQQLKIPISFKDINDVPQNAPPSPFSVPPQFRPPYVPPPQFHRPPPPPLMALPPGVPPYYVPPIYFPPPQRPVCPTAPIVHSHTVSLKFGNKEVTAKGVNKNQARINAALDALRILAPSLEKLAESEKVAESPSNKSDSSTDSDCDDEKENAEDDRKKSRHKSVVSLIHEKALQMRMDVEFEILKESGEPHKRQYLMRCMLSNSIDVIMADGEGGSKKSAKQAACSKMLSKLNNLKSDPVYIASALLKTTRRTSGTAKEQKRKTIVKDMKKDPLYGHHINPISRLIQVMQINHDPDPKFEVVGEHGQGRYKEFIVEVSCKGLQCEGTGPNKKLAKRAAAEAMLAKIGYVKPMPQPGKSLLKKRSTDELPPIDTFTCEEFVSPSMDIGVFDPNALCGSPDTEEQVEESVSPEVQSSKNLTFADVDRCLRDEEFEVRKVTEQFQSIKVESPVPNDSDDGSIAVRKESKRRVTFSSHVSACPPPDDTTYPESLIAPLKSELIVEGKIRKGKRDSKKALTDEQKQQIVSLSTAFLSIYKQSIDSTESPCKCLDSISKSIRFVCTYTDFPREESSEQQYFSLVTLGIEKPIVCHGSGVSQETAHNDAAFNALETLSKLSLTTITPNNV